ncbi:MAG TPA: thiamine pyrophosphate-binding protein [Gemmataceae bacterium]|jgi:acetolactate synthase-1/2/3 large subunit
MAIASKLSYTQPKRITVAQCLLKYLQLEGVKKLFGVPGGALKYVLDELRKQQDRFEYVICRQETGAAYMADGYARVTSGLGVVLVTSGPGATNALTGAVNAQCSNSSVLVVSGEVPEEDFGKGYLQEGMDSGLDVNAVYRSACQYTAVISSPLDFQTLFAQALRSAMARPRRTTHVSLPEDISKEPLPEAKVPVNVCNYRATPCCSAPEQAKTALAHLLGADHPLLFLGAGCREALSEPKRCQRFQQFIEKFALPVMTSPGAKALLPESHALSLRTYGLAGCEWPKYYLQPSLLDPHLPPHYDCLMVLASSLGDLATNMWEKTLTPERPFLFLQVDLDQTALGRAFPIDLGIIAEIGQFLDDLFAQGDQVAADAQSVQARRAFVARIKERSAYREPDKRDCDDAPIRPQALMKCLSEELPAGAHVFIDAGNCVGWALHYLTIDPPSQVHSALAMGPMGFGVGSVVGAKLGAPDRVCIGIVGDGAFLMHGSEVSTAARYGVGAIWIVLFDNDLAMVSQGMGHYFPRPGWKNYYQIGKPNLAKFAQSLGATAYGIDSPAQFRRSFSRAVKAAKTKKKPQVIIAHHDTKEIPPYYPPRK